MHAALRCPRKRPLCIHPQLVRRVGLHLVHRYASEILVDLRQRTTCALTDHPPKFQFARLGAMYYSSVGTSGMDAESASRHASRRSANASSDTAKIPAAISPAFAAPAAPIAIVATGKPLGI